MRFQLIFVFCLILAGCGSAQPNIMAETPRASDTPPKKFEEPGGAYTLNIQETDWSPASIGPDGAAMLAEALKKKESIMILVGSHMQGPTYEDRIYQMVKAAAPETKIVARNPVVLDEIMLERGEIPYRQTIEVGGQDVLGRPWLLPKDHPLNTDWLTKKKNLKGADAILLIDFVSPDDQKLRQMRAQVRGGCDAFISELKGGVAQSASYFTGITTQVNAALATEFTRQMRAALPFWEEELKRGMAQVTPASEEGRCLSAYEKMLSRYQPCQNGSCPLAPMLHMNGAGVIGMELSGAAIVPHTCPVGMGRDYVRELSSIGQQIALKTMTEIPAAWASAFTKMHVLTQLETALSEQCAPAHRRYAEADLATAKKALNSFLQQAVSATTSGKWEAAEGEERVPGVGAVRVFARATAATSPNLRFEDELQRIFDPLNRCKDSKRRPVQLVLVDVGSSEVYFSAIVFEEQVFCENLPPQ
ncbi:MAG: hypothetical protein JXR76_17410 [Deltaproteobacteria bacterium]|nr:hypothetical protein [Deltaproteobacteria bacterium]